MSSSQTQKDKFQLFLRKCLNSATYAELVAKQFISHQINFEQLQKSAFSTSDINQQPLTQLLNKAKIKTVFKKQILNYVRQSQSQSQKKAQCKQSSKKASTLTLTLTNAQNEQIAQLYDQCKIISNNVEQVQNGIIELQQNGEQIKQTIHHKYQQLIQKLESKREQMISEVDTIQNQKLLAMNAQLRQGIQIEKKAVKLQKKLQQVITNNDNDNHNSHNKQSQTQSSESKIDKVLTTIQVLFFVYLLSQFSVFE
jgi:hypothetical protein